MFHANFHGDFFNLSKIASRPGLVHAGRVLSVRVTRTAGCAGHSGPTDHVSIRRARVCTLSLFCLPATSQQSSDSCHMMASSGPLLLILSSSFSCLAYQRRLVGHRAGTLHIKSSACPAPPRSFATLFFCKRRGMAGAV